MNELKMPVIYIGSTPTPSSMLNVDLLMAMAPWEERTSARFEAFWSTTDAPYTYGQGAGVRTYYPHPMPDLIRQVKRSMEFAVGAMFGYDFDFKLCFVNRYDHQHQHLGWHADDSPEQDDKAPIIVMSFGAEREIWVRKNGTGGNESIFKQKLENGSVFIMEPGMQQTHQHRIPKADKPVGPRISLTWRALK